MQAIIKFLGKKDKDQRLISNWIPILLSNAGYKILSKMFASRLKKLLPDPVTSQQTA